MTEQKLQPVYRRDYRVPDYWIDSVQLSFQLEERATRVLASMQVRANDAVDGVLRPLVLNGEGLQTQAIRIDGRELPSDEWQIEESQLTVAAPSKSFCLETEVLIDPHANTELSGLYTSSGNFCTQCEAEGFRRITWFLDRPDVMARFTTRIEADAERYAVLLSNGNRTGGGKLAGGRHWVRWEDPFPKPSYLFALVAGRLEACRGEFVTRSGRSVQLEIWVEPENIDSCDHALLSLKKSMAWDEEVFGLEYDLDIYMVVAVNDFNMGAMENKGLNVFNSKYVLAKPETATDDDYDGIEAVIAHEYFHNWTGNRVTCRDWFQLTLKEGLTVYRDQEFSADQSSAAVKRIEDVMQLRSAQFAEDSGPMSHPVRPESYVEMNNFYTTTVYEKGAEIVRLYQRLLGREGFRRGMDLYFERHDGSAVTCNDFRAAMADANDVDLTDFEAWYCQSGTPTLRAQGRYDAQSKQYHLTLEQSAGRAANSNADKADAVVSKANAELERLKEIPLPIPVLVALIGSDGNDMAIAYPASTASKRSGDTQAAEPKAMLVPEVKVGERGCLLLLRESEQTFTFDNVEEPPVLSALRDFSAPVKWIQERDRKQLALQMACDRDAFNRWDAGQELAQSVLLETISKIQNGKALSLDADWLGAFGKVVDDSTLDSALKAKAMELPGERYLGQQMDCVDPVSIHRAREFCALELARSLRTELWQLFEANCDNRAYSLDRDAVNRRLLKNMALGLLSRLEEPQVVAAAMEQFKTSNNMTDCYAALEILCELNAEERGEALESFYTRWKQDPLVLDKWFRVQALSARPQTLQEVIRLRGHSDFHLGNPNRVRSLIGCFAQLNQLGFHAGTGEGYRFIADNVIELDSINPQVASRLVSAFNHWRRFDAERQAAMSCELERIAAHAGLSRDVGEIVSRALRS